MRLGPATNDVRRPINHYLCAMNTPITEYPATLVLLVLNIAVSLLAFMKPAVLDYLALSPFKMIARGEYHQIVTSGFVHADYFHLAVNMMTLYFFGPALEQITLSATGGRGAYLVIYALSLVAGSAYPLWKYRRAPKYSAVGASGAISGIVFAYCLFDPLKLLYVFFAIPMPAVLYAVLFVGYSIYAMRKVDDHIAHEGHLGGAIGGIVATFIMAPGIVFFLR